MSALLRIWPLLLTLPLQLSVGDAPQQKLIVMSLGGVTAAIGLLYYLMTQNIKSPHRSRRPRLSALR